MQKIFRLLLVVSAIGIGIDYFVHWSRTRALNSGAVHVRQESQNTARPETPPETPPADTAGEPAPPQEVASNNNEQPRPQPDSVATLPAAQTISRNPPNGVLVSGTGKYALYRQGDLTFRLNTETGDACVLFATQEEWSKSLVYDHGCARH
jgi:hypothetical protein